MDQSLTQEDVLSPGLLTSQGRILRRLAAELLGDAHQAEDAVQQAWLKALERPPRRQGVLAWLRVVTRNASISMRRSRERSRIREAEVARPEALPATDEVLARADLHRRVSAAVYALAEPYRSTLLLRFYEDLSTEEVARMQGVATATVRSRVHRGLRKLKEELESDSRFGRGRWIAALLPLVDFDALARGAPAGGAVSSLSTWTSSLLLKAAALVMLVAAATFWVGRSSGISDRESGTTSPALALESLAPPQPEAAQRTLAREVAAAAPAPSELASGRAEPGPGLFLLSGRVLDERGEPAPRAWVFYNVALLGAAVEAAHEPPWVRADGSGRFRIESVDPIHSVVARASGHGSSGVYEPLLRPGRPASLAITLSGSGSDIHGTVVDSSGAPVGGALIRVGSFTGGIGLGVVGADDLAARTAPPALARTDSTGAFHIPGIPAGKFAVVVVAPGFEPFTGHFEVGSTPAHHEIVLRRGLTLEGQLRDASGRVVPGGWIGLSPALPSARVFTLAGADGRFVLEGLPLGPWRVAATKGGRFAEMFLPAASQPGQVVHWDPILREGVQVRARLLDETGAALAGWRGVIEWDVSLPGSDEASGEPEPFHWSRRLQNRTELLTDPAGEIFAAHPSADGARLHVLGPHRHWSSPLLSLRLSPEHEGAQEVRVPSSVLTAAAFRLRLRDAGGDPVRIQKLVALNVETGDRLEVPFEEQDAGWIEASPVPEGSYHLLVSDRGQHHRSLGVFEIRSPGADLGVLDLPADGLLEVRFTGVPDRLDEFAPGVLAIEQLLPGHEPELAKLFSLTGGPGTISLAPGRYRLQAGASEPSPAVFGIDPGQVTTLEVLFPLAWAKQP